MEQFVEFANLEEEYCIHIFALKEPPLMHGRSLTLQKIRRHVKGARVVHGIRGLATFQVLPVSIQPVPSIMLVLSIIEHPLFDIYGLCFRTGGPIACFVGGKGGR